MGKRFGRNQKRKLREQRDECVDLANRAVDARLRADATARRAEWELADLNRELEHLIGYHRHSSLKPAEDTPGPHYNQVVMEVRREAQMRLSDFTLMPREAHYTRIYLDELHAYVAEDPPLGFHLRVRHGEDGFSYFLSAKALALGGPHVMDETIHHVSREFARRLVEAKRAALAKR